MSDRFSLLILPGDGIGPEVMAEVRKVIDWFGDRRGLHIDVDEDLVGGCAYDAHGTPLTDATMAKAQAAESDPATTRHVEHRRPRGLASDLGGGGVEAAQVAADPCLREQPAGPRRSC